MSGTGVPGQDTQTPGRKTRAPGRKKGPEGESPNRTLGPAVTWSQQCLRAGNPRRVKFRAQTPVQFSAEEGGKEKSADDKRES